MVICQIIRGVRPETSQPLLGDQRGVGVREEQHEEGDQEQEMDNLVNKVLGVEGIADQSKDPVFQAVQDSLEPEHNLENK